MSIHWPTAVNAALSDAAHGLLPAMSEASSAAVDGFALGRDLQSRRSLPRPIHERSVAFGRAVAGAILDWSDTDGFALLAGCDYAPSDEPSAWIPTPPAFLPALEPCWRYIRPMALQAVEDFAARGHPQFSTDEGSVFHASAMDVHQVGLTLTDEQKTIADYWNDAPGLTGTPPGHWIAIVSQIARNDQLSLMAAAEAYARVGVAVHDAFICCWHQKYRDNLLRPVTYVREHIDPSWSSYITTPPFPTYTSGHSTQSGTAALVLTGMFGKKAFTDTTHLDHRQGPATEPRTFASFEHAAEEAMLSRLYGGIHFDFDNLHGLHSGQLIGQAILNNVEFSGRRGAGQ
jgi:hypothetical protein